MKRKRKTTAECVKKQPKLAHHVDAAAATLPLLQHYYPEVLSLRRYLASRGHGTSRKRRRKILQYGSTDGNTDGMVNDRQVDLALVHLLDTTLIGIPKARYTGSSQAGRDCRFRHLAIIQENPE
ncbi:hypothetical protein KC317_g14455 [Hortaea werneckii]|nr:hypothetical protein KC317_g14455 [Hortaea werneckii]KAI7720207.1 hypothetical protein KC322_g1838 [Hortaea werneckii]